MSSTIAAEPEQQFCGVPARPGLFELVSHGAITGEMAWLLLTIDAHQTTNTTVLAAAIHRSRACVRKMLRNLFERGLVPANLPSA